MAIQVSAIAGFYAIVLVVGLRAARRERQQDSTANLLLANRKLPLWIGIFTMTATWVGGGYINGTAEVVYDKSQGLVWAQAPWGYALSLIVGGIFFARPMRRAGYTTMLDPFAERYDTKVAALLFLPALLGELFWAAAILLALGTTFATIFELDFELSIVISAAVAIGYTLCGGLWSVASTDVIQLAMIVLGLGIALPFAMRTAGGPAHVAASYTTDLAGFPRGREIWPWLDSALMLVLGGIPWQVYFQRVLACRTPRAAMHLSIGSGMAALLIALPAVGIGMTAAVFDWPAAGLPQPVSNAVVLPHVLKYLAPPVVSVLGLAAVAAAVMSSVDSSILSTSSMFTWNLVRPFCNSSVTDRFMRRVLRTTVVAVGAAATLLALKLKSVYALWFLCADLAYVVLFPQLVMVLFARRSNAAGAVSGAVVGFVVRLSGGVAELGLAAWIPADVAAHLPIRTIAMLACWFTIVVVSRWTWSARD